MLNLAKRVNHWVWDPNEERKRLESWHQEQERLLQVHWCNAVNLHGSKGCTGHVCAIVRMLYMCGFFLLLLHFFVCFSCMRR